MGPPSLKKLDLNGRINHFNWLFEEHCGFISQEDREYFWGKGLSNSGLGQFHKSVDHYFYDERRETQAMVIGSACHTYVLEPHRFDDRFAIRPKVDRRTNAGKEEWKVFEASLVREDGRLKGVLSDDDMGMIYNIRQSIFSHPLAEGLFKNGIAEESCIWNDPNTKCLMKSKTDWRMPDEKIIIDLKTTKDGSPEYLKRSMFSMRYHVQNALYLDGVTEITGESGYRFLFVFVEKFPPYAISVIELDADAYDLGRRTYVQDIEKVILWLEMANDRINSGDHESLSCGYSEDVILLETPKWLYWV